MKRLLCFLLIIPALCFGGGQVRIPSLWRPATPTKMYQSFNTENVIDYGLVGFPMSTTGAVTFANRTVITRTNSALYSASGAVVSSVSPPLHSTISFWYRSNFNGASGGVDLFNVGNRSTAGIYAYLTFDNSGAKSQGLNIQTAGGQYKGVSLGTSNVWRHLYIVVSCPNYAHYVYTNGVYWTVSNSGGNINGTGPTWFGSFLNNTNGTYFVEQYDVRIGSALTSFPALSEIQRVYQEGRATLPR